MRLKWLLFFSLPFIFARAMAQKGEKSLAAGLLVAFSDGSTTYSRSHYHWGMGIGLDITGQSNLSNKGALLLQLQVTRFRGSSSSPSLLYTPSITPVSLKAGYRHQLGSAGFYTNGLVGFEYAEQDFYLPIAVGIGKRIPI